jgi:hypothetical protein
VGAGAVVLLVVGILVAIGVLFVAIGVPLLRRLRRRITALETAMAGEAAASGERIALGPEPGVYRGGDPPFPRLKGNAVVMLTDRRLECRMAVGPSVTVPIDEITGTSAERWFHGAATGGQTHVVVSTTSGAQVAFFVADASRWINALAPNAPT